MDDKGRGTMHRAPTDKHRRSIRLQGYDYTQAGAYFVTICTYERALTLGTIDDDTMVLSAWGEIVQAEWDQTAVVRPYVDLDAFVIMPNHVHGIIVITDSTVGAQTDQPNTVGATRRVAPTGPSPHSLGAIIGQFKSIVTKRINRQRESTTPPIWQRNYYEHIIRDEDDLNRIREYITLNPAKWVDDQHYHEESNQ